MSIAELNNRAISLLLSERSKPDAIKILKQAVESLRADVQVAPQAQNPEVCLIQEIRRDDRISQSIYY